METFPLVSEITLFDSPPSSLINVISSLAAAKLSPDWVSVESNVSGVSIHQHSLSRCIDEVLYSQLLTSAPNSHSRALVHFSSLPHPGDWFTVVPSAVLGLHSYLTKNFARAFSIGLGFVSKERKGSAPIVIT